MSALTLFDIKPFSVRFRKAEVRLTEHYLVRLVERSMTTDLSQGTLAKVLQESRLLSYDHGGSTYLYHRGRDMVSVLVAEADGSLSAVTAYPGSTCGWFRQGLVTPTEGLDILGQVDKAAEAPATEVVHETPAAVITVQRAEPKKRKHGSITEALRTRLEALPDGMPLTAKWLSELARVPVTNAATFLVQETVRGRVSRESPGKYKKTSLKGVGV